MVPLASLVDVAFLGHLAEINHLAGVAIATVLFNYIYWTFGFLRMGTTGLTAQAQGRGENQQVILTLLRNGAIALCLGLLILILQKPLRDIGFSLLQADLAVIEAGRTYYNALIWGAPANLINFVLLGWFLGKEQGGKVLLISFINKSTNIVLDYIFIVLWGQASYGAGLATAISQYITLVLGLILVLQEISWSTLQQSCKKIINIPAFQATFSLNRDILIRTLALVSTFALFTNLSATMGTRTLAVNTLLLQIITLAAYFIDGIAFATESIAGNLHGQGKKDELLPLVRLAGGTSLLAGLFFAVAFGLFPQSLFSLLTNHGEIIKELNLYVWWLLPILSFGSVAYMLDGYFLGITAVKILRQSTIIAMFLGFVPTAIIAWYWQSEHLLWLALVLFMATRSITLGLKVK